ncbi:unnamed protein product [Cuscuta epithymum]|uniref:Uncharacterized protein n=1 Tax=Cuscuta epithymum TaxID=186058 RepID=A0AAV0GHD3_9ASTE|nr:unnamed protein product [Cuscuta epithymum]
MSSALWVLQVWGSALRCGFISFLLFAYNENSPAYMTFSCIILFSILSTLNRKTSYFEIKNICRRLPVKWLCKEFQVSPHYVSLAVSDLLEKIFWRMFDSGFYEHCGTAGKSIKS